MTISAYPLNCRIALSHAQFRAGDNPGSTLRVAPE